MSRKSKLLECLETSWLTIATMVGVVLGGVFGFLLRLTKGDESFTEREVMYIAFTGDLFLRMLKALILPLIIPSLITAVGSLDLSLSKKVGLRAVIFYLTTTIIAVILGISLVSLIRPGARGSWEEEEVLDSGRNTTTEDTLMDLVRNVFPDNIVRAMIQTQKLELIYPGPNGTYEDDGYFRDPVKRKTWKHREEYVDGTNILGLVMFAVVLGFAISILKEKGKPLLSVFRCLTNAMMLITTWVIYLAPIGVFFLVAGQILENADALDKFKQLGLYFATVLIGLTIHGFLVLPLIFIISTRTLPFRYIANMGRALITAFGTSSSSATVPITLRCLEEKNGVDRRVTRFVIPIGATINMDGTALYEAVAAIFIAQVNRRRLSFVNLATISITATTASIGAAGIPQAGLVTMVMVLETVGLPAHEVTTILAVDWLLDRFRTMINVLGDALGAGIVFHLSKEQLEEMEDPKIQSNKQQKDP